MSMDETVNILLVDDQPAKLLSYEVILGELGETLIKAASAREALGHLLKNDIAVILVDVCMPDLDGFELAEMIREHPRYQKTAIIFVSAVMMTELDRLRGYRAGAVDYVSVPVVPDVLRAKVKVFAELFRKTRQLEQLNAALEERVQERTAALEASSEQLRQLNDELEHRIEERTREREQAMAQLFEAQKLDTIGQLTGGVAHDFNNLLMAVLGSLELLKKRLPHDERTARLLDNAVQGAQRGAALTQRLLAFARRQELRPEAVDFTRLFDGMEDLLKRALGPSVRVTKMFPEDLPPVSIDANQLELALLNLAVNARDAMPLGGELTVTAKEANALSGKLPVGVNPKDYVRICVSDDGVGMDTATLARATEPFFTTKGPGKGTGLGLSMVQGLAAQSGGALHIESEPGRGTTISILLPSAAGSKVETPVSMPINGAIPMQRRRTVLIVDDDPLVCTGTAAMLEDLGHTVIEASTGLEALDTLRVNSEIDLVITDHAMPGMTGTELARRIRGTHPSLAIVLATGYAELPQGEGHELALPRLSKPYGQEELALAVANACKIASDSAPPRSLAAPN